MLSKIFGKIKITPSAPWLGTDERLFTLKLCHVENPLDPSPLWNSLYGGGKQITESITGSTGLRLRDALDLHRATVISRDSRGWKTEDRKVFTDVILWIPRSVWNQEIQLSCKKTEILCDRLSRLHEADFGDHLMAEREPSYAVMPLDAKYLKEDEVIFQFGLGVFIPRDEDFLTGKISLKLKDRKQWQSLPDWIFWKQGKRIVRPAGLYEKQQFVLLGAEPEFAALRVPETEGGEKTWFSHGKGNIWFNLGDTEGKDGYGCPGFVERLQGSSAGEAREILFRDECPASEEKNEGPELLMIRMEPVTAQMQENQQDSQTEKIPDADFLRHFQRGRTIIPGMIRHQLVLEGIALIKPEFVPGLESWILRIDKNGHPAQNHAGNAKEPDLLTFSAAFRENQICWRRTGEKEFFPVKQLPFTLPDINGLTFHLIPSPLPDQYLALLLLPEPRFIPVDEEGFLLGRAVAEPGLRLDSLVQPGSLKWQPGRDQPDATLGHIGISGEHAKVALRKDQLAVQMEKGSTAFYVLDKDRNLKYTFMPWQKKEIMADPDDCLLLGPYLLRFV
ncbi:MAG: hypothetical protein AB7S75_03530 [Desulfococcaceae bacterium]